MNYSKNFYEQNPEHSQLMVPKGRFLINAGDWAGLLETGFVGKG